jgi:glycosyltransferase involved in cell wall biosynthesis
MRIGIDVHTLGSQASGNENYYLQLLRDLARKDANGDRYVIYFTHLKGRMKIPVADQFEIKRIRPANPLIRIPLSFPFEFRRERLDVFHAQYIIPPFCNCRAVTTIHDILFEGHPELFTRGENFRFRTLIPWSARRADHIITVSQFSKNDIVARYHVDPEKVSVIDEAPRDEFRLMNVEECRQTILTKYGITHPFLLYVGRVNPRKNLMRLVEAFTVLRRRGMAHKLVIVGKQDWAAEQLVRRVKELSLEDAVVFTGYVEWDDVPIFYNAAELLAFPSICEGFGAPVLEAMACGVPVVTSYGSSLEEVAGEAAVLADPFSVTSIADAIEKVLADPVLRRSLRDRGLKRVADFSGARKAQQTVSIYHKVCGRT